MDLVYNRQYHSPDSGSRSQVRYALLFQSEEREIKLYTNEEFPLLLVKSDHFNRDHLRLGPCFTLGFFLEENGGEG